MQYRGVGSSGKKPLCSDGRSFLSPNAKGPTTPFLDEKECEVQADQDEAVLTHNPQHVLSPRSTVDSKASKRGATLHTAKVKSIPTKSADAASVAHRKMDASVKKREKVDCKSRKAVDDGWCSWEGEGVERLREKNSKTDPEEYHRASVSHPHRKQVLRSLLQKKEKISFPSSSALASEKPNAVLGSDQSAFPTESGTKSKERRKKKRSGTASSKRALWSSKVTESRRSGDVHRKLSTEKVPSSRRKWREKLKLRASSTAFEQKESSRTIPAGVPLSTTSSSSSSWSASSSFRPHLNYSTSHKWMVVTPNVYYMKVDMMMGEDSDVEKIKDAPSAEETREKKKRKVPAGNVSSSSLRPSNNAVIPSSSVDLLVRKQYEVARLREGSNIAKLLVLFRSMYGIFSALPNQKESVQYVQRMDVPALIKKNRTMKGGNMSNPLRLSSLSLLDHPNEEFIENTRACLAQRILVEHTADHFFCIDVRDAEALTPPPHLTSPFLPVPSPSSSTTALPHSNQESNGKENKKSAKNKVDAYSDSRRRYREKSKAANLGSETSPTASLSSSMVSSGSDSTASSSAALSPPLDGHPVDRLKELQKWRFTAFRRAEESLSQLDLRPDVHAITRFRVQEPIHIDVTTVESYGGVAKDNAVEAAWDQFTNGQYGIDTEEGKEKNDADVAFGSDEKGKKKKPSREELDVLKSVFSCIFSHPSPSERSQLLQSLFAKGVVSPFLLKPNFTVYGSCLPRREMRLGQHVTSPVLREWVDDEKKSDDGTLLHTPTQKSANAGSRRQLSSPHSRDSIGVEPHEEEFSLFSLPTLPRFSTVMTILIDHRGMTLSELMDEKEKTVSKKEGLAQHEAQRVQVHHEKRENSISSPPFASNSLRDEEGNQQQRTNVDTSYIASRKWENDERIEKRSLLPRIYGLVRNGASIV